MADMAATVTTSPDAKGIARTMLQQIGNRTLAAVHPSMLTYGTLANGDTVLRFLTGGTNGKRLRKAEITYNRGRDTYTVRSWVGGLAWSTAGTTLGYQCKYEADDVYCENLATVLVAAVRAAGGRPRI
jgi:hypothetical protein